jgi:hypothetical protein
MIMQRLARLKTLWSGGSSSGTANESVFDHERRIRQLEARLDVLTALPRVDAATRDARGFGISRANPLPPYLPDRSGLEIQFLVGRMVPSQPPSLWIDTRTNPAGPVLLGRREPLQPGDRMRILDDLGHDLSVGVTMIKVEHERIGCAGFVTLHTLIAETTEIAESLWVAEQKNVLRGLVESVSQYGILYSTNRVSPVEVQASIEYLEQFATAAGDNLDAFLREVHPLQAGAHAHRLGIWALDEKRSAEERTRVGRLIDGMFEVYGLPSMHRIGAAGAWPYRFDFSMPWGTKLAAPWYSGYANAAIAGAAACALALTGKPRYRELVRDAVAFLRRPMAEGGALYRSDGYPYIAEYCYPSPPIPNDRVLDGELCSIVYLYNAALILADSGLLDFVIDLWPGLSHFLDMMCVEKDGLPVFGMDGQPMNPAYMWQLWMTLQLVANGLKDRRFAAHARRWRSGIPQQSVDDGCPV